MLTRLRVNGFKNLVDVEVRFGPLTCIAGLNGVGKSNLFDAIRFLALLADHPFVEAAQGVRGGSELRELFTVGGDGRMAFDCDLLIPEHGTDDFNQPAQATQTFLNYRLELQLREDARGLPRVELISEALAAIPRSEAKRRLGFPHDEEWRKQVVASAHRRAAYITMEGEGPTRRVRVSADKMLPVGGERRGGGKPSDVLAQGSPRTALSGVQNADEARTVVLTRHEMRRWRILQLEPRALREPDAFAASDTMTAEGAHLPATLYRLASSGAPEVDVCAELSSRLARLVDDVRSVRVERDDVRRVLRIMLREQGLEELPAASLSDGTLRFIALATLQLDPQATGVLCLEEPENGIHPERIDAMIELLADIAVDPTQPAARDNPLRQVIVSTHSPLVLTRVPEDAIVFADRRDVATNDRKHHHGALVLRPVSSSWRSVEGVDALSLGKLLRYLGATQPSVEDALFHRDTVLSRRGYQLTLQLTDAG